MGLTGTEIGELLHDCGLADVSGPAETKRVRLANALESRVQQEGSNTVVLRVVREALQPVRFLRKADQYEHVRSMVNDCLRLLGVELTEQGKYRVVTATKTLPEVAARRKRLVDEMRRRGVHAEVIRFCKIDLLHEDCFGASLEATKGVAQRIRDMTGLTEDGADLFQEVFSVNDPYIAINTLRTRTEKSEQTGLSNVLVGLFGLFRNPAAHVPRVRWFGSEEDALDLFSTLSMVHRRLDTAAVVRRAQGC